MNKKLKEKLLKSAKPRNIKWLFGGAFPTPYLYIYEGLPDDFILWYEKEYLKGQKWHNITRWGLDDITHTDLMIKLWMQRVRWISNFSNLVRQPFEKKRHITSCGIETKQEYCDFKTADILDVIKYFGMAAQFLYSAENNVFNSCHVLNDVYEPLNEYYLSSHEYLTWLVATFWQGGSFTDFYTLVEKKMKPPPNNPWCEHCQEKDCFVGRDNKCEMIRVYEKMRKECKKI